MNIRVLMFATLAYETGYRQVDLELADQSTAADALDLLSRHYDSVRRMRSQLAVAVNAAYTNPAHCLSDGDELALIPPVSGG